MVKQSWYAPSLKPYSTVTGRLASDLVSVLPTRARNPQDKIAFDFQYQLRFNPDSDYQYYFTDMSSQELWIAAMLAQAFAGGEFGSDPFLAAMLTGSKEQATDLYSLVANSIGIKRNQAKGAVLATLYGAGQKLFSKELLKSIPTEAEKEQVKPLTKIAFQKMKGVKKSDGLFYDGIASNFFNYTVVNSSNGRPVLPIFKQPFPQVLNPSYLGKSVSQTGLTNYFVQSSAATSGQLSIFLTALQHQFNQAGLTARYSCSIHDCYVVIGLKVDEEKIAKAMIATYLQTWALTINQLGLNKLPTKLLTDCVVDVSDCLRKSARATISVPGFNYNTIGKQYRVSPVTGELECITDASQMLD